MTRDDIIRMAQKAGWSGIYTQWREPDGSPNWRPVKESLTVPVTMEQIERFAALFAAAEREACAQVAAIALLGADKSLSDRVVNAIRARGEQ